VIPELGHFALTLALMAALLQSTLPLVGAHKGYRSWMALALGASRAQCLCVVVAFLGLAWSFAVNDFTVDYVSRNSNSALPLAYRLSAVWGAHEGSLLLWILILNLWAAAVSLRSGSLPLPVRARVLAVMGWISVGFLLFLLLTSNPFERLVPGPTDGQDLNPLLQDPGLIIHPPVLYTGYVGFSVAFAFAVAGLLGGQLNSDWARWARPWTLMAWSFLTLGIGLGSWWAYYELGWGGWWFWDPVENASFMPWLLGTALVHSLAATEKREVFKNWTVLLAIGAFGLSLLGTFLVRSGVLTSVHAFASDPARGVFILIFLAVIIGGALVLFAWRGPRVLESQSFDLHSRETFLLTNSALLAVATGTVLLGTLYPLALDALSLGKISVGPPYFNAVFVPIMAPILVLLGWGQIAHWNRDTAQRIAQVLWPAGIAAVSISICVWVMLEGPHRLKAALGVLLGLWVTAATLVALYDRCRRYQQPWRALVTLPPAFKGQCLAHTGFAVTVIGIALVSMLSSESHVRLAPGDSLSVGQYEFRFERTRDVTGPNYTGTAAEFAVLLHGTQIAALHPEKRNYLTRKQSMTEAGIDAGFTRDLYVALGEPLDGGAWSVRVNIKPFVRWLWLGALMMAAGAAIAACDPRFRARKRGVLGSSGVEQTVHRLA